MAEHSQTEAIPVVVEFPARAGRQQVTLKPAEAVEKSAEAIERSMDTISSMAQRVNATIETLGAIRPDEVTVEFGIKFDTEAGAIIAKAGLEASMRIELVWKGERSGEE